MANYITYTTPTMTFSADGTNVWSLNEFNAPSVTLEGSIVLDKDTLPCVSVSISDILNRLDNKPELTCEDVNSLHEQGNDVVVDFDKVSGEYKSIAHLIPKVVKTYINGDTTVVKFADGTYTKAVCKPGDSFNPETGICICLFKRVLDRLVSGHGSSVYNKLMDYALAKGIESSEKKTKKQPKKKGNKHEKSKKA